MNVLARLLRPLRSHLALRLYLAGVIQITVVIIGFIAISIAFRPKGGGGFERDLEFSISVMADHIADPTELTRELKRRYEISHTEITIYDDAGNVIASGVQPPVPIPTSDDSRHRTARIQLRDGRRVLAVYGLPHFGPPTRELAIIIALVLIVVGITAFPVAWSVIKPLTRVSETARAFGSGALDARVRLSRTDQIGQVAASFDEMADQVVQMIRAQKELLANISHELRTPLARIRVAIDLAAEGDADTARESLSEITQDLGELEQLVSDVLTSARLDLSQTGANALPFNAERVHPASIVERAASRFRTAHPDRELVVSGSSLAAEIHADSMLLRRALDNLLENAAKYSSAASGPIALELTTNRDVVTFRVRDQGAGLSEEDLAHVFEPFYRADRSRTRSTGGLGLGLTLSKRIAEAHAGTLRLESALGKGTTAILTVPIADAANAA